MRTLKEILVIVWLLAQACIVCAQSLVKVGGVVRDGSGNAVEFASVRIKGTPFGTVSGVRGRYSLKFAPCDSVVIVFSMVGYETVERKLVRPRGNIPMNVILPLRDNYLAEVEVQAARQQTNQVQSLSPQQAATLPDVSAGNKVESYISTQAGVGSNNELSAGYTVRGGSYDENLVYLNGFEVFRPMLVRQGEQEGLSILNVEMVDNLRFSTGGFDVTYGDKMSSVLDVTYKRLRKTEGSFQLDLLGTSVYLGTGGDKWSWLNAIRYKSNKYLLGTLDTQADYQPHSIDYQTYLVYDANTRWQMEVYGDVSRSSYHFKPEDRYTMYGTASDVRNFKVYYEGLEDDVFKTMQWAFRVAYKPCAGHRVALSASLYKAREAIDYDILSEYWLSAIRGDVPEQEEDPGIGLLQQHAHNLLDATVEQVSLDGEHTYSRGTVRWGATVRHDRITAHTDEYEKQDRTTLSGMEQIGDLSITNYRLWAENEAHNLRLAFYLQQTSRFRFSAGSLTAVVGLRGTYWDWNREFLVSPRLSVGFVPASNRNITLRLASGVYYQTPFYREMQDTLASKGTVTLNHDIRSQRSVQVVLGGDYAFRLLGRPFRLTAEAYYKHLDNLIPYEIDNVELKYYGRNLSKGYAVGIDLKLFGEFVEGADSWLTFSLLKTEEKLNGRWLPRPTDQRYRVNLVFTDNFPGSTRWLLTLKGSLAGALPYGPRYGGREQGVFRSSPYRRIDIGLSYVLHKGDALHSSRRLVVGVEVFNLFDTRNVGSYYWISDMEGTQYAVPNYLTSRRFNLSLQYRF